MKTVVILNNTQMGAGSAELGQKILGTFLRKTGVFKDLVAIVLYNDGVRLCCEGSPVLAELKTLYANGVDLKPCVTCLDALGLTELLAVARPSNMDEILWELDAADKVITL
jgi:hypothetical protein